MRALKRHWQLTAIALASLSIAMAVGIAALSVSNTVLLLPPSAKNPERLVMVYERSPSKLFGEISYPDYQYFRRNNRVFTDVAAAPESISVNGSWNGKQWIKVIVRPVSDNYFQVMGIHPHLGRLFSPGDDSAKAPVAVMTYACWRRLGSDPDIVGKTVTGYTIAGVAEQDFTGALWGPNGDLFISIWKRAGDVSWLARRDVRNLALFGRLKPGVTRVQAQADLAALSGQLASAYPNDDRDWKTVVTRATLLPPDTVATAQVAIGILMALVLLVLLIACANVANLLLAIAVGRRQEAAIKIALGAPRWRLVGDFLRESALLCAASAVLGYIIAMFGVARLSQLTLDLPQVGAFTFTIDLRLDANVVVFTLLLMLIAIFATGLAPALYASSPHLSQVLGGEIVVGGTRKNVRRNALMLLQVAMCTVVLIGMGLCLRDLYNLRHVDPGFSARNLVAASGYAIGDDVSHGKRRQMYDDLKRSIAALPGVESATLATDLPLAWGFNSIPLLEPGGDKLPVSNSTVDDDYFSTFGIPLLQGRVFNSSDRKDTPEVAVINRKLAETVWPGQDALGRTFQLGDPPRTVTVVGVVANGKYEQLDEDPKPCAYLALSQHDLLAVNVIARTRGDPRLWIEPLANAVRAHGLMTLFQPVTLSTWENFSLLVERISTNVVAGLSVLGLLLAVMGLFGAISYSVSERKRELGIRVALGAGPRQLLEMVLRETLLVAGSGVAIGVAAGVAVTALLRSQLYGVGTLEWTILLPVTAGMLTVALMVAWVSARPWIKIDPMQAVRHT